MNEIWRGRPSVWAFFWSWFVGLILLPFGVGLVFIVLAIIRRASIEYVIAETKVIVRAGIFVKSSRELRISDIRSINVARAGIVGLLGIGDVVFSTAAHAGSDVIFASLPNAEAATNIVRQMQDGWTPKARELGTIQAPSSAPFSFFAVLILGIVATLVVSAAAYRAACPTPTPAPIALIRNATPPSAHAPVSTEAHSPMSDAPAPSVAAQPAPPPNLGNFDVLVRESGARAATKHPDLVKLGTPFRARYTVRLQQWKTANDPRLSRTDYPELLADSLAEK